MQPSSYPQESIKLIGIAQLLKDQMRAITMTQTVVDTRGIIENKVELETYINTQDIVISDQELFSKCTSAEWHLIGRITYDLKMCNALWKWPEDMRNNSTVKKAIRGLIQKNILSKTSAKHIYIVNPTAIRRGKDWKVALSTAQAIHDNSGIDESIIRDLRPIDRFDFTSHNGRPLQIGYGYVADE